MEHKEPEQQDLLQAIVKTNSALIDLHRLQEKRLKTEERWTRMKMLAIGIPLAIMVIFYTFSAGMLVKDRSTSHVAVITLQGQIGASGSASAEKVMQSLNGAFKNEHAVAVALRINSPGGSPVQSEMIHTEMLRLRSKYPQKPILVFGEDMMASGGYYIASAADEIFIHPATLTGSIGVVYESFGLTGLMEKLGIERRSLTAGDSKSAFGSPFAEQTESEVAALSEVMEGIHQRFIEVVVSARGDKLNADTPGLFEGKVFMGADAVSAGLVDHLGAMNDVIAGRYPETSVRHYGRSQWASLLDELSARMVTFVTTPSIR